MLRLFKLVALLEGLSLLFLIFFAMPMKYAFDRPEFVRVIGMAHGVLFICYIILAFMVREERRWSWNVFALVCLASVLPFGTFYMDWKYLRKAD